MTDADQRTLNYFMWESGDVDDDGDQIIRYYETPTDLHAVYSKMVERGEWDEFYGDMLDVKMKETNFRMMLSDFTAWLSCYGCPDQIPERMGMAAEFLKEVKDDK